MKYERLTERRSNLVIDKCGNCENVRNPQGCTEHRCYEVIKTRLAELEDKIENGTLIDTRVKIGQRVYMRGFWKGDFDEYIVSNIIMENGELKYHLKHDFDEGKTCYSVTVFTLKEFEEVFLTEAEAEQN